MKYRKKPVVVDVADVSDLIQSAIEKWSDLPEWVVSAYEEGDITFCHGRLHVNTLEGTMVALPGDKLIKGVLGEIYPCKQKAFDETYEEVSDA